MTARRIRDTRISYVFQNYREALFPWLRAIDNIHYPLKVLGMPRKERARRVEKLLADFDVQIDLNAYPYTLSGGQQQTVSILRALVTEPEVLFLDEPFSALDYEMTLFMRERLQNIFMKTKTTTLLVSHDLEEAIQLADKVVLLTRRPTRVAEIVDVELPWPRDLDVTTGEGFIALKRHCLDRFWREVKDETRSLRNRALRDMETAMRKRRFRAAAVQTLARLGDYDHNIALATQYVEEAVRQGAELVVFPECMDTGYLFNSAGTLPGARRNRCPDGPFVTALSTLEQEARHLHRKRRHRMGPGSRRRSSTAASCSAARARSSAHYHKQFLATHDQNWFAFGERGCPVVETDLGRIGLLICFDGRIPEIFRAHGDAGSRSHRGHGEFLRHGSGRNVGTGAQLTKTAFGWSPQPRPATNDRSIIPAAA